jgi:hypothetical protein
MDDRFLHEQRQEPAPGFTRALRERLRGIEAEAPAPRGFRFHPALASALAVALVAASFSLPAVRVAAQSALDLFRVHTFEAVEIDPARIDQLKKLQDEHGNDPAMMVFDKQEVTQDPGKPMEYPSADLAGSAAGLPGLRKPASLPSGLTFEKAAVTGPGRARLTLHADRLQHVLDALGITDTRVPPGLDGQSITVHMPPHVMQLYANGNHHLSILEGTSPEVALPPGANLQQLGELGLRVLGLDAAEARRVAASVDWRSTLLVPVPTNAASFRQVDVNGHKGLFIRMEGDGTGEGPKGKRGAMVMWTEGERVLAVQSDLPNEEVLEVATSLR